MAQRGPLDPFYNDRTGEPIDPDPSFVPSDVPGGSLRRFTQKQFASKVAIVGSKIDRALRDLVDRYNQLQPQDVGKRWVHVVRTGGYSPSLDRQTPFPYLPVWNGSPSNVFDAGSASNLYRFKGSPDTGTLDPTADPYALPIWTQQFYFRKPARLIGVNWNALSCGGTLEGLSNMYADTFKYGTPAPPNKHEGEWVNDLYLDVSITNRFYPQDMTKAETCVQRFAVDARMMLFSELQPGSAYDSIVPVYPMTTDQYTPYGVYMDIRNINVQIPEFSVVRLGIIGAPLYPSGVPGWTPQGHVTSWTVTTAEALR